MIQSKANLAAILSFVVGIVIGVTANLLTPVIVSAVKLIATNWLPWMMVFILAFLLIAVLFLWRQDKKKDRGLELAASLLLLLPQLIDQQDLSIGLHGMAKLLLASTVESFRFDIRRGILLLPDDQREYLCIFEQCGTASEENKEKEKFYIGADETREQERGIAGRIFKNSNPQTHISYFQTEKDYIQAVKDGYKVFDHERRANGSARPPYNSLICVPVRGMHGIMLGVICFDSKQRNDFKSRDVQDALNILAKYIMIVLMIKEELQKLHDKFKITQQPVPIQMEVLPQGE